MNQWYAVSDLLSQYLFDSSIILASITRMDGDSYRAIQTINGNLDLGTFPTLGQAQSVVEISVEESLAAL